MYGSTCIISLWTAVRDKEWCFCRARRTIRAIRIEIKGCFSFVKQGPIPWGLPKTKAATIIPQNEGGVNLISFWSNFDILVNDEIVPAPMTVYRQQGPIRQAADDSFRLLFVRRMDAIRTPAIQCGGVSKVVSVENRITCKLNETGCGVNLNLFHLAFSFLETFLMTSAWKLPCCEW